MSNDNNNLESEKMKFFEKANLVLPSALFLITLMTFIFTAGKLTESINHNTAAIQNNTVQIQKNSAEIMTLKEYKASSETELKNMNEKLCEISSDVKELLKKNN